MPEPHAITEESNTAPNRPADSKRFDRVEAAIWMREGRNGKFAVAAFSRSYRDRDHHWHRTGDFTARDLPHLSDAVAWAKKQVDPDGEDFDG